MSGEVLGTETVMVRSHTQNDTPKATQRVGGRASLNLGHKTSVLELSLRQQSLPTILTNGKNVYVNLVKSYQVLNYNKWFN